MTKSHFDFTFHISQDKETGISHSVQSKVWKIATFTDDIQFHQQTAAQGTTPDEVYTDDTSFPHIVVSLSGALPHD